MSEFWIVASIGHCATKWLAETLDDQDGVKAHHELKTAVSGMSWQKALKYEQRNGAASAKYKDYWSRIDQDLKENQIVVDVNSWGPTAVPNVASFRPVDRIIYITRHGVCQLHSIWKHSKAWGESPLNSYHLTDYIQEISGLDDVSKLDRWERLCHLWTGFAAEIIGKETVSFEQLTQAPTGLQKILPHIANVGTLKYRKRDVNRKVSGNRQPAALWAQWSPEMKETFTAVCGEAMAAMGYEVPS